MKDLLKAAELMLIRFFHTGPSASRCVIVHFVTAVQCNAYGNTSSVKATTHSQRFVYTP